MKQRLEEWREVIGVIVAIAVIFFLYPEVVGTILLVTIIVLVPILLITVCFVSGIRDFFGRR